MEIMELASNTYKKKQKKIMELASNKMSTKV